MRFSLHQHMKVLTSLLFLVTYKPLSWHDLQMMTKFYFASALESVDLIDMFSNMLSKVNDTALLESSALSSDVLS